MSSITCQKCGKKFDSSADGIYTHVQSSLCPYCGHKNAEGTSGTSAASSATVPALPQVSSAPGSGATPPSSAASKMRPEFDANRQGRFLSAYVNTIKALLVNPKDYFKKYELFTNLKSLFLFAYLNQLVSLIPVLLVQGLLLAILGHFGQGDQEAQQILRYLPGFAGVYFIFALLFLPPLQMLFLGALAGIHHLFLRIIGSTQKDYTTTLQMHLHFTFTSVVTIPFVLIAFVPLIGILANLAILAFIVTYAIFYQILGMSQVHGIQTDRAAYSYVCLIVFCCCCCILPWPILGGFMGSHHY